MTSVIAGTRTDPNGKTITRNRIVNGTLADLAVDKMITIMSSTGDYAQRIMVMPALPATKPSEESKEE